MSGPIDIEALKAVAEKATPGPWELDRYVVHGKNYGLRGLVLTPTEPTEDDDGKRGLLMTGSGGAMSWTEYVAKPGGSDADDDNFAFIAAANPAVALSLIARTEAAEGENEQLRLAICGGEDVPGLAASLPLHTVLGIQHDNVAISRSALERLWTEQARTAELVAQRDGLVEALAAYDAKCGGCPIAKSSAYRNARCPECRATASESCGREALASIALMNAIRSFATTPEAQP